jgi:flagellar protein FlaF
MTNAAQIYSKVAKQVSNPRDLEATLLIDAAARLQVALDAQQDDPRKLGDAFQNNRKLWTILLTSVTKENNPLPIEIRQNVASLGVFVMSQTMAAIAEPTAENITPLIEINRQLAAGLMGRP